MSPLGLEQALKVINQGDSAEIVISLTGNDYQAADPTTISDVTFTVNFPDGSQTIATGEIQDDGSGFIRVTDTQQTGVYQILGRFTFNTGEVRSSIRSFEVVNPFKPAKITGKDLVADHVWMRLEDCFDSIDGGPWVQDETRALFDQKKIGMLISDALFEINQQPHAGNITLELFTTSLPDGTDNPDLGLIVQGTLVAAIRHLMRSYVEQPLPTGAQVVYEDRRDYLQRWQIIYQIELDRYNRWISLWKRQFLGYSHSALLVSAKAGRLLPAPMRSRNIGRGYY